ncbi:MAG: signal peptidase I [Steroidobacteraceae bacterium]
MVVLSALLAVLGLERLLRQRSWQWLTGSAAFARSMLPLALLIFSGRAFAYEPMRVPSGSMTPTLLTGDYILVDKHAYGLRNPFGNGRLAGSGVPAPGDVVVFRYPGDRSQRYVKRVVGVPGDVVEVRDGWVLLNGRRLDAAPVGPFLDTGSPGGPVLRLEYGEQLAGHSHPVLRCVNACRPGVDGRWTVPPGRYFVMGDNRDNSADSRYWGYVSDADLVGRVERVWFHLKTFGPDRGLRPERIGAPVG